jgi:hypothetical protein
MTEPMSDNKRPIIIACAVLRETIGKLAGQEGIQVVVMDYGLHLTPQKMRAAIQEEIDRIEAARLVLIGFGLCGNGLVGLKSGKHTLVIPRVDDCVALFFGSRAAFLKEFRSDPATYYLTPGWLECGGEPRSEYLKCSEKYGPEKARVITDTLYGRYRNACFLALTAEDLEKYGPQARQVADFCREHWGWLYRETLGSDGFIRRLLSFADRRNDPDALRDSPEFIIIRPGEEVTQQPFMLQEMDQEVSNPCSTCTTK